jgi:hypothetical protein
MNLLKTLQEEAGRAETAQPSAASDEGARPRHLFTEGEALSRMGTRLRRGTAIGEVKGYEYVREREEKGLRHHGYVLYVRWDDGQVEQIEKTDTPQGWRPHLRP